MELTILERIVLLGILPKEANYVTLKIINDLRNELSFNEKEIKEFGIREEGQNVTWNMQKARTKKIEIGERMYEIIVSALKKLDEANKINAENASLYEKFVLTIKN